MPPSQKSHCKNGHEFSPENTYWKGGTRRECRECHRLQVRAARTRNPQAHLDALQRYRERPENRDAKLDYMREYMRRLDVKARHRARNAVKDALRSGRLVRPDACEECHGTSRPLDAHHADYAAPLQVRWLCRQCHATLHASERSDGFPHRLHASRI